MDNFEGMEKRIELLFEGNSSLLLLKEDDINEILETAQCSILVKRELLNFNAYILSESSMFIYNNKIIILTCGKTSLLLCIPVIIRKAIVIGLECILYQFTRGEYTFPDEQNYPHRSFEEECEYLNNNIQNMEYKIVNLNEKYFWQNKKYKNLNVQNCTKYVCYNISLNTDYINDIIKSISKYIDSYDDYVFTPCGYSLNAYKDDNYLTIHVTPQDNCSYVSIETMGIHIDNKCIKELYNIFNKNYFFNLKTFQNKSILIYFYIWLLWSTPCSIAGISSWYIL